MRLILRKETLAELSADDLALVAGGTLSKGPICVSEPSYGAICIADPSDRIAECDSMFRPCVSNTCTR